MDDDEIFNRVRELNSAIVKAQRNVAEANTLLNETLPQLKELLDATRNKTRQTSLDEFTTEKSIITPVTNIESLAKSNLDSKLLSELFTLEDIRKMMEDKL
mgnify:FL=1|jgi:ABC-type transporter Mla subunit MlaD